jgi:enoyl-CoA hydratase/carnithine racemase
MSFFEDYRDKSAVAHLERDDRGILLLRLHTRGGPFKFGSDNADRYQLCDLFIDIANDPDNKVLIMTGTGDSFCDDIAPGLASAQTDPLTWDHMYRNRRRLLMNLLEIEAPIVAAVNGPALMHSEVALLSDIVLASDTTVFQDRRHFLEGGLPADGVHVLWPFLLGPVRGKYFLITGQKIEADEALQLGIVNEVLSRDRLLARAWEHAEYIAARPILSVRYTRAVINFQLKQLMQQGLSHALALQGLANVQLRGWRMWDGGSPPDWEEPTWMAEPSPLRPRTPRN